MRGVKFKEIKFLIKMQRVRNHHCISCLHPHQQSCVINCDITGKLVKVETVLSKLCDFEFHCRLQVMILLVLHKFTLFLTHITVNYFLWRFGNFTMTLTTFQRLNLSNLSRIHEETGLTVLYSDYSKNINGGKDRDLLLQ